VPKADKPQVRATVIAMHPASLFHTHDTQTLINRLRANPFAIVTANGDTSPVIAHAPVLISDDGREMRFHLSRNNALVSLLNDGMGAKVVATGDHAYISPDWYGLDDQVPTWNYLSVEAEGLITVLNSVETIQLLDDLSAAFEAGLSPKPPWTRDKMGEGVFDKMVRGIVGYSLAVRSLIGVTKLSQNKPIAAQRGVVDALGVAHSLARAMAKG
jgi:transcriptional regulator